MSNNNNPQLFGLLATLKTYVNEYKQPNLLPSQYQGRLNRVYQKKDEILRKYPQSRQLVLDTISGRN